ncbi:retinol dehydrogenase 13 [Lingula anatina]|uniref:Retinol dehydrogenase 13 n=1 Tax=Lingula anatina TaxID=7574 RepID=A0A1S3I1T8_LINAN|nr:retinol dehydrogenase 13 [Lingula anatina]XP_013391306.1 retinol dehydrogenase 13 [Lingula anatina]XP_013391314.1 retinol dehydrogenase 13 [Lingula anatina]|eukprot:XP_013391296.1 retinol dehydrogenase 13 [Lingula anatina]
MVQFSRGVTWMSYVGTTVGGFVLLKYIYGGARYEEDTQIPGKTVIITGASSGIGKATALELTKRGARVILACRDLKAAEEVKTKIIEETNSSLVFVKKLDLASLTSIRNFAADINKTQKRVDVLINNAGVMYCPQSVTREGFEMHLGVNHFGPFLLTNLLLDKMKQSKPSRIICVNDSVYKDGQIDFKDLNCKKFYDERHAYRQSKLANMLFVNELDRRLKDTGVTVNAVNPGICNTKIHRHSKTYHSIFLGNILGFLLTIFASNPQQGSQTVVYAAVAPELEEVSGKYFSNCKEENINPVGKDTKAAERLWLISEKWTRLVS